MFLLRPEQNNLESFNATYSNFYISDKISCESKHPKLSCKPFYFYGICYDIDCEEKLFDAKCRCLYTNRRVRAVCDNGTYGLMEETMFDYCKFTKLIDHIYLSHKIDIIYQPISLLIILSSIFKLYRFEEIQNEFHWSLIVYLLLLYSAQSISSLMIVIFNNPQIVYYVCSIFLLLKVYSHSYLSVLTLITTIYLYGIIAYVDTQLETLRRALYYIAFTAPLIEAGIGILADSLIETNSYISCRTHSLNATVVFEELILTVAVILIVILLSFRIRYYLRDLSHTEGGNDIYRVEYDILGNREEISYNTIHDLLYCVKHQFVLLILYIIISIVSILLYKTYDTKNLSIAIIIVQLRDIILLLYIIEVVWRNPSLNMLMEALNKWYTDIDLDIENRFENKEFLDEVSKMVSSTKRMSDVEADIENPD